VTVAGSPVQLTGLGALSASSGQKGGVGLLAEGLLGGLGALAVLAVVFASLLAIVPLIMAVVSIMTTFLLVWALTTLTSVSGMVAFLIGLVGLGVAIDYSLLIIVRWREERAHGHQARRQSSARWPPPAAVQPHIAPRASTDRNVEEPTMPTQTATGWATTPRSWPRR
jgi:uncharacterized membrane protein YdfJ with MMPL/SSD domain